MIKRFLSVIAFCFLLFAISSSPVRAQSCDRTCSADAPYEIVPCGVACGDVLFLYGNNYRLCSTDPTFPAPALGSRNGSWYYDKNTFPSGTVLYNGVTFNVPNGGAYLCDSNVFGCANSTCSGGPIRGCDDPRDGDKDTGCYGSTLKKGSPDENLIDWLVRKVKTFFHWGGDGPIEVTELTIPIEGDLDKLLGSESQEGTLPKLTPPGTPSEELRQNWTSYLKDFSRGSLDVTSCKTPGSKDVEFGVPDVWGLKNTAVNLFSYLVRVPGASSGPTASSKEDYQVNTADVGEGDFEPRLLGRAETLGCKNLGAGATSKPTVRLAQTGSVLGDPPSGCYGPGLCDKIEAPDKNVCLTNGSYGLIGSADDPTQPAPEEGDICTIPDAETRTCTAYDVLGGLPPSPPCPAGPELPVCTVIGETFVCNEDIPSCDNSSTNDLSMPPRISFLGGPEGYTDNIIETYRIFTVPEMSFKNDLFGEGEFDWTYQNVDEKDEEAKYRKLGTVQCLEDHVQQALSLPGHGLTLEEGCLEGESSDGDGFEGEGDFLVEKTANPTRIANGQIASGVDVTFNIKITATKKDLKNVRVTNSTSVEKKDGTSFTINKGLDPDTREEINITAWDIGDLAMGDSWQVSYIIRVDDQDPTRNFRDSKIVDSVEVKAD